jgi:protein-disulfide isomerase
MHDRIADGLTGVLVLCAIIITAAVLHREMAGSPPAAAEITLQADWRDYATGTRLTGPATALVTITEFADFQCPACKLFEERLGRVRSLYPDEVRVIFRHSPLRMHLFAMSAARASECANEQGRFVMMHDLLFQHQDSLGAIAWTRIADEAAVDTVRFAACMKQGKVDARISTDTAAAHRLGITGTPTVLVNGVRFTGTQSEQDLKRIVVMQLQLARNN